MQEHMVLGQAHRVAVGGGPDRAIVSVHAVDEAAPGRWTVRGREGWGVLSPLRWALGGCGGARTRARAGEREGV